MIHKAFIQLKIICTIYTKITLNKVLYSIYFHIKYFENKIIVLFKK